MMTRSPFDKAKKELKEIGKVLVASDSLADYRLIVAEDRGEIGGNFSYSRFPPTVLEYFELIKNREYTFLLSDGSIIQLSLLFDVNSNELIKYRYLYCNPQPFIPNMRRVWTGSASLLEDVFYSLLAMAVKEGGAFYRPDLSDEAIDVFAEAQELDYSLASMAKALQLPSSIRFDFDLYGRNEIWHPAAHVTFFADNVRLALDRPLTPSLFVAMTIAHFSRLDGKDVIFSKLTTIKELGISLVASEKLRDELLRIARSQQVHLSNTPSTGS